MSQPARRPRRGDAAPQDDVTQPPGVPQRAPKRRRRGAERDQAAGEPAAEQAASSSEGSPWPSLPHAFLLQVLSQLDHGDVVSVGQTCSLWREAARHRDVWRKRVVEYQVTDYRAPLRVHFFDRLNRNRSCSTAHFNHHWHDNARRFSRIVRFAPCAARVSCSGKIQLAAMNALFTQSQCQPKAVELNGATVAAVKYLTKWTESIQDVTLLNPSLECLQAAISLPGLTDLAIKFKLDLSERDYQVPSIEGPSSFTLKRLIFNRDVHESAIDSLIRAHAESLEAVSAYCFPAAALSTCLRLGRLALDVEPKAQGQQLLLLLRGRGPLQGLAFRSFGRHDAAACEVLRRRIKTEALVQEDVSCDSCERGGPVYVDFHSRMRRRLARLNKLGFN